MSTRTMVGAAILMVILLRALLIQVFMVDGVSMNPGLLHGDRVIVEKISYQLGAPNRGDTVIFETESSTTSAKSLPEDALSLVTGVLGFGLADGSNYIKRIVAVAGQSVTYVGTPRRLIIDGEVQEEPFLEGGTDPSSGSITFADCRRLQMRVTDDGCEVPRGTVFVLGDNRGNSQDSRDLGPIDRTKIVGRVVAIAWPPMQMGSV